MRLKPATIIKTLLEHNRNVSATARALGIGRSTIYRWIARARSHQELLRQRGIQRISTRPHTHRNALTLPQQAAVVQLRKQTGYSAIKIKYALGLEVGVNTIHRLLKRKQLLNHYRNHRRPRYQKTTHMHLSNTTMSATYKWMSNTSHPT